MTRNQELGRRAEEAAAGYLASLGWKILGRNVSNPYGELDIVALDGPETEDPELVVVEVRFRSAGKLQSPLDSVGPKKLRTLTNAGQAYVDAINWTGPWRIDVIGITAPLAGPLRLEHVRAA